MEKSVFVNLVNEIENGINQNKEKVEQALNKEVSKGNLITIDRVYYALKYYKNIDEPFNEGKSIAVSYPGRPEITVSYILDSILYNNQITLCVNENKIVNDVLITIIVESMRRLNIRNMWINYNSTYNEIYLRDNEKEYDELVYIGDFYEYQMFKQFFKKEVEYNNYGYIKILIDKAQNKDEYQKIMQYAAKENICLETYTDIDEFVNESKETDFAVAFINDFKDINKLQKMMRSEELLINTFPYDTYNFKIR